MVQALLTLTENTSRALDVVKAKYRLKDKSAAVEFLVSKYIDDSGDPELRPEFIEELIRIQREPSIRVNDFAARYGVRARRQADGGRHLRTALPKRP